VFIKASGQGISKESLKITPDDWIRVYIPQKLHESWACSKSIKFATAGTSDKNIRGVRDEASIPEIHNAILYAKQIGILINVLNADPDLLIDRRKFKSGFNAFVVSELCRHPNSICC